MLHFVVLNILHCLSCRVIGPARPSADMLAAAAQLTEAEARLRYGPYESTCGHHCRVLIAKLPCDCMSMNWSVDCFFEKVDDYFFHWRFIIS